MYPNSIPSYITIKVGGFLIDHGSIHPVRVLVFGRAIPPQELVNEILGHLLEGSPLKNESKYS